MKISGFHLTCYKFQVLGMRTNEVDWLCKHLGHTAKVHDLHYKNMSGYIERNNLGKLFLMQDYNCAKKFTGKNLIDVDVKGNFFPHKNYVVIRGLTMHANNRLTGHEQAICD